MTNLEKVFNKYRVTKQGLHPMVENYLKFERDAKRYQWLRERHENTIMDIYNSISPEMISPELFDAAIDAAMKENT
jgi:hypothetical protein